MPFHFDETAQPLPRIQALEEAVRALGATAEDDSWAELDKRLTNIENALEINAAASKDLDQRHRDLYAMVTAMQDRLTPAPAPGTTAPAPKTTAAKSAA